MKHLRKTVLFAASTALALVLGAQAAYGCAFYWASADGSNRAECSLIGSGGGSCTYECLCYGDCSGIYRQFGMKKIN
jgi:hypothetical protein